MVVVEVHLAVTTTGVTSQAISVDQDQCETIFETSANVCKGRLQCPALILTAFFRRKLRSRGITQLAPDHTFFESVRTGLEWGCPLQGP